MKRTIVTVFFLMLPALVEAQVVTQPTQALFSYSDADFAAVLSFHIDFYQCASLTAGQCVGRAVAPINGTDVLKAAVTGADPNRVISLTAPPIGGILPSLPAGIPFVANLYANGDPNLGMAGQSGRSNDTNPFFSQAKATAAPSQVRVK